MIKIRDEAEYGDKISKSEEDKNIVYFLKYPCDDYSSCHPIEITFEPGFYFLECWGGSGTFILRNSYVGKGGTGGYSSGVFVNKKRTRLFLYIGASKNLTFGAEKLNSTFNGSPGGNNREDGVGGGATDFRRRNGEWNENPSSRIIVAAGGGSGRTSSTYGFYEIKGGDGGGLEGEPGQGVTCTSPYGGQNKSIVQECEKTGFIHGTFGSGAGNFWSGGGRGWWGGGCVGYGAGGGGSGYIGGVVSFGKYKAITKKTDDAFGFGKAKITIISDFPRYLLCKTYSCRLNNKFFLMIHIILVSH